MSWVFNFCHCSVFFFTIDISDVNRVCAGLQAEKVHELNEEIGKLLAKAEQLGAEGNVDEAQKVLQEVEKVRTRKKDAEVGEEYFGSTSTLQECGAFSYINKSIVWSFNDLFFLFIFFPRKNTETPCRRPASSSRSFGCARCALLTWVSMTMTVVWPTILVGNFTWASSRSERNWTN